MWTPFFAFDFLVYLIIILAGVVVSPLPFSFFNPKKKRRCRASLFTKELPVTNPNGKNYTTERRYEPKYSDDPNDAGTKYQLSGDLFIIRSTARLDMDAPVRRKTRSAITRFSLSSSARMSKFLRECDAVYTHFITLTYPKLFPEDGRECKRHLKIFLQRLRERCARKGSGESFSAFWFMEFQSRGAVHFHIFTTTFVSYQWLAYEWARICGYSGKIRDDHEKSGTSIEKIRAGRNGTAKYARKYAAKHAQKEIPSGFLNAGRFWGVSGNKKVLSATTTFFADSLKNELVLIKKQLLHEHIAFGVGQSYMIPVKRSYGFRMFRLNVPRSDPWVKQLEDLLHCNNSNNVPRGTSCLKVLLKDSLVRKMYSCSVYVADVKEGLMSLAGYTQSINGFWCKDEPHIFYVGYDRAERESERQSSLFGV